MNSVQIGMERNKNVDGKVRPVRDPSKKLFASSKLAVGEGTKRTDQMQLRRNVRTS